MDIKLFTKILNDKQFTNYKKMSYKYKDNFKEFLTDLESLFYTKLPLKDFDGNPIVYIESRANINNNVVKMLSHSQNESYGFKSTEDEIIATSAIESIDFSRESVRNILKGFAPKDEEENRIAGIKKGFELISDTQNSITEENLHKLYMMTVGDFLDDNAKLQDGMLYRNDSVYIISNQLEHSGLDYKKIPEYMKLLIDFANCDDKIDDLVKASVIHFYIAYIHPYFDGNGRIARLVHLWFLIQKGYQSTLFVPFSSKIEKTRKAYYNAYTAIEENKRYSGKIDITPFLIYFADNVYNAYDEKTTDDDLLREYKKYLDGGEITEKESQLWKFVLSNYGTDEFSTKMLEKDFQNAAYATIRGFVQKFERLGLLSSTKYGTRIKYKINT